MTIRSVRLLAQVSAIALVTVATATPAQASWFSFDKSNKYGKGYYQPPKTSYPVHPAPAPTPSPTPGPTPAPSSSGGAVDVPEPGMVGLFGLGIAGLALARRRRKDARTA